ncbi:Transglycosylase SLT domain-containing protein [Agromyces sp. CF514]|uniref:aggregation-promoting factor C-terminal-like domain-containing protein n=1 Tax=Agromyces sp. CF514 TaxID=1881031 RepID=UPI0008E4CD9F|nr:transglycosylase SLT domain-containing protein [Agromyces sp. CF514]SFR79317.1 Transglycosylase SLT domain-containing protein [Agromyces sp. CF514]
MQNQTPSPENTQIVETEAKRSGRRAAGTVRRFKAPLITAGAIVAVGALVGSGYAVQGEATAKAQRVEETAALSLAAERDSRQGLAVDHGAVLDVRAAKQAEDTLTVATKAIASAAGKADASALATTVAALDSYERLSPSKVFELVDTTKSQTDQVVKAVAEADRVAAEKAAAAAAAKAKAEAEAAAAAEAAADDSASSGSTGGGTPSAPANPSEAQAIARDMMASRYGWGEDQFGCLVALWNKESGWNVYASNPSGAYGIPQALPGSKMSSAGADWATNPATQISWGLGYIAGRYGSACGAWNTSESQGWY